MLMQPKPSSMKTFAKMLGERVQMRESRNRPPK
jgi:hypothetical protein